LNGVVKAPEKFFNAGPEIDLVENTNPVRPKPRFFSLTIQAAANGANFQIFPIPVVHLCPQTTH
jgi:hypothetical protein